MGYLDHPPLLRHRDLHGRGEYGVTPTTTAVPHQLRWQPCSTLVVERAYWGVVVGSQISLPSMCRSQVRPPSPDAASQRNTTLHPRTAQIWRSHHRRRRCMPFLLKSVDRSGESKEARPEGRKPSPLVRSNDDPASQMLPSAQGYLKSTVPAALCIAAWSAEVICDITVAYVVTAADLIRHRCHKTDRIASLYQVLSCIPRICA